MNQTEAEILQYEAQLEQVQLAAAELSDGPEKEKLEALEADLKELINLSKTTFCDSNDDPLLEEYKLFKAELEKESSCKNENSQNLDLSNSCNDDINYDLREDLNKLKGKKCQAPFTFKWTNDVTYYNAFITQVVQPVELNAYDDINVRVMFTNPTHKEMLPCPYYLEGNCRFSDEKCRYSHGELVSLSSLKDYREPDFLKLCRGYKVLAKQDDGLWYRATVIKVNESHCTVKFESNSKEEDILFHNILPLAFSWENAKCLTASVSIADDSDPCDENTSSDEDEVVISQKSKDDNLIKRILIAPPGSALGEWEQFTKGFGSKIMKKMGYIHGTGLGKNGTGRVEPVPAVILPTGKSLDHCMMLKEKAGNDQDLFKAERKLKYLQKKHEDKLKRAYNAEKEKTDVFSFLNTTLHASKVPSASRVKVKNEFKNETVRNLNVTGLQIAEELRKVEREIKSLNQSLARHSPSTHGYNVIKEKLAFKESQLLQLHISEKKILTEQDRRRDRQKLTEF